MASPAVTVACDESCRASAVPFRLGAPVWLTIAAKMTLRLVNAGEAVVVAPDAVRPEEQRDPDGYVRAASDLRPWLPRAEVLVVGRARPTVSSGGDALLRLGYWRGESILIDKSCVVRQVERGPMLVPAMGPISEWAPERVCWLNGAPPPDRREPSPSVAPAIDPRFFQSAPSDQQLDQILGGDGLLLDEMVAGVGRLATRLPHLELCAAVSGPGPSGATRHVRLVPSVLTVDLDRAVAHLLFRGSLEIAEPANAYRVSVRSTRPAPEAPVAIQDADEPDEEIDLAATMLRPPVARVSTSAEGRRAAADETESLARTAAIDPAEADRVRALAATPFEPPRRTPTERQPNPPVDGGAAALGTRAGGSEPLEEPPLDRTTALDPTAAGKARAWRATPFDPTPSVTPSVQPALPATREERASAWFVTTDDGSTRSDADLARTVTLDPGALALARAADAIPFERSTAAAPHLGMPPAASASAPPERLEPAEESSGPSDLGATAYLSPAESARLRAHAATPFATAPSTPPAEAAAAGALSQAGAERTTGFGASFLRALAAIEAP